MQIKIGTKSYDSVPKVGRKCETGTKRVESVPKVCWKCETGTKGDISVPVLLNPSQDNSDIEFYFL